MIIKQGSLETRYEIRLRYSQCTNDCITFIFSPLFLPQAVLCSCSSYYVTTLFLGSGGGVIIFVYMVDYFQVLSEVAISG